MRVSEHPDGVSGEIVSPRTPDRELTEAVRSQVARILSLDVDGSGFPAMGRRDRVVAELKELPGIGDFSDELARLSENWKPYRAWVCLLLRAQLEDETGEINGRPRHPGE